MESEIKNGDQQTEALEIDFVIDLEMYRNWQKMEISKILIAYYQKRKCFTGIFVSLLYVAEWLLSFHQLRTQSDKTIFWP